MEKDLQLGLLDRGVLVYSLRNAWGGVVSWGISELSTYFNSQAFAVVGNSSLQRLSAGVLVEVAASIIDNRQPLNQDDDAFTPTFASSRQHYNLATVYFTSNNSTIISRTRLSTMHIYSHQPFRCSKLLSEALLEDIDRAESPNSNLSIASCICKSFLT